jgi:hypothetical protein
MCSRIRTNCQTGTTCTRINTYVLLVVVYSTDATCVHPRGVELLQCSSRETGVTLATRAECHVAAYRFSSNLRRLETIILVHLFVIIFIGARQVLIEPESTYRRAVVVEMFLIDS